MSIDLHCHSYISDGALAPAEVVRRAHANGCTLLALTDHDHTGGLAEARAEAQQLGLQLVSGVEISTSWRHHTIHIVGLNFDEHHAPLQQLLQQLRQGRLQRLRAMADKLSKKGIEGAYEGALRYSRNPESVSRTHLAEFLIERGYVRHKADAFRKYLGDGKCGYVRHEWTALKTAVQVIRQAGGLAVMAHPIRYHLSATARRNLFADFKSAGGTAIEVHSGSMNQNDRLNYALLAQQFDFLASSGSDFHRDNDFSGGILGACPELPPTCRPVWTAFQTATP